MTIENSPDMSTCLELPQEQPIDKISSCPPLSQSPCPLGELPSEYPEESTSLVPCPVCNRTFSPSALTRHSKVCEKLSTKKRHIFDSTKQRSEHLQDALPPPRKDSKEHNKTKAKSRWREKRAEFLRAIRAAKGDQDEDDGEGGRRPSIPSDYAQCPHCQRYFGPKAADRHIAWCEEQKTRMPRSHTSEDVEAVQRLKTRTKYIPPKPGQNGWRAPKKKDVISSIPPPNVGANVTPPGRLISPPPPAHRQLSPPPISPSRKGSSASLPPGPPRYHHTTGSLGRHAGKQFTSLLQSMAGYSPGYGTSSGYGSSALYGSPSGLHSSPNNPSHFNRSASLRLPRRRQGGSQRMARHRDLASDMMASVSIGGKAKRGEPEGDEAHNTFHDSMSYENNKHDDAPYDPFSAAELQFQALFGPPKESVYGSSRSHLGGSGWMGSTSSLKTLGMRKSRDCSPNRLRNRSSSISGGYLSLCSLGLDESDLKSLGGDSSELENSPKEMLSPEEEFENILSHFSPIRESKIEKYRQKSPPRNLLRENNRFSPTRNLSTTQRTLGSSYSRNTPTRPTNLLTSNAETKFPRISPPKTNLTLDESIEYKYSPSHTLNPNSSSLFDSSRLSPSRSSFSNSLFRHSPSPETRSGFLSSPGSKSPTRFSSSLSPTPLESHDRKPGDGSHWRKSPSPVSSYLQKGTSERESSPYRQYCRSPMDYQKKSLDTDSNDSKSSNNHFAWTKTADSHSPNSYSRHFGVRSGKESAKQAFSSPSPQDSIKSLKNSIMEDINRHKKPFERLDETHNRISSGSSTDSSLPPLSSPTLSTSPTVGQKENYSTTSQITRFCHECGHKYPVTVAKFCCQCGARRITVDE